jgi:photosystem II stability/assembly factor-like uncharacterized protein
MRYVLGLIMMLVIQQITGQEWVTMLTDSTFNFYEARRSFEAYLETRDQTQHIPGKKQFDRASYFLDSRVDEDGYPARPEGTWVDYQRLVKERDSGKFLQSSNWTPLGPFVVPVNSPGMGRINCIAFHPTQSAVLYAGAASGGVWKSTTAGNYWHPMSDHIASLGISSIVVDHQNPDIVYAATGDFNASDTYSVGVLKSLDGGTTWNTTGLSYDVTNQRRISKLIMHPDNPNILYAGTTIGVMKTIDGGATWAVVRTGSVGDLSFKPGNPSIIYAVINSRFWRSVNDGVSFSIISTTFTDPVNRAKIAVTQADSNYVYMITIKTSDSGYEGIYRSVDGGTTFTKMSSSPNILGYATNGSSSGGIAWYALGITVSPTNKNEVFAACVNVWRSTNGGATWNIRAHWYGDNGLPYVHADIHYMAYHPITGDLYVCSDGGVDVTSNSGASFTQKNAGLAIGQVYRIGLSKQDYRRIIGGWQDNGTHFLNNTTWKHMLGGDGMECIISHTNYNYMYGESQYGNIHRTFDGGNNWVKISDDIGEEGSWITPVVMHPTSHGTLLAGYDNIYRTTNSGGSWVPLTSFTSSGYYDKFRSIAYAPSNTNYIYAATYNRIYRSSNGGQTWIQINNNLPSYPITYIAVDNHNPQVVYLTFAGFYAGNKVYKTTNGGTTWINISGTLPNLPANCIIHEKNTPGGIYAGLDVGVFYRDSTLTDWVPFFTGLPNVKIAELEIHYDSHRLVAATYGRGIWWSDTYTWLNSVNEINPGSGASFNVYPNPSDGDFAVTLNGHTAQIEEVKLFTSTGVLAGTWGSGSRASFMHITGQGHLAPGLYMMLVKLTDGTTSSGKLLIRK